MSPYGTAGAPRRGRRQRPLGPLDARRATLPRQGLSRVEVDMLFRAQGGRCALCLRALSAGDYAVDHDHFLAREHGHGERVGCERCVRGLLCRGCNSFLSGFRDDPAFLRRAADYSGRRRR